MKPRRRARLLRGGVSLLSGVAFAVLVLGKKSALARSLGRIGHPHWSWIAFGVLLEASSMATFAMMQRRLLRIGRRRVGTWPMTATIFAANSLSVSVPVAGPELGAAFTFRRFREQGADTSLAAWTLLVGGLVSWFGAVVVLAAGGVLSGKILVTGVTIFAGLFAASVGLVVWVGVGRTRLRLVRGTFRHLGESGRFPVFVASARRPGRGGQRLDRGFPLAASLQVRVGQDRWVGARQLAH